MRLNPGRMFSFVQIKSQTPTEREEGRRLPTNASLTQPGAQTVRRMPDWKPQWSSAGKYTPPRLNAAQLTPKKVPQTLDPPRLLNPFTFSHLQPAPQTGSVFHYSAFQLPSAIPQHL